MAEGMRSRFAEVGLAYNFTETSITGNTFNGHRLVNLSETFGPEIHDKVVEELFKNNYVDDLYVGDMTVLYNAAIKSGIKEDVAKKFV